jgi:DNA polymerase III gamma/tau subunit
MATMLATPPEQIASLLPSNRSDEQSSISTTHGAPPPYVDGDDDEPAPYDEPDQDDEQDDGAAPTSPSNATTPSAASAIAIPVPNPIATAADTGGGETAPQFEQSDSRIDLEEIWSNLIDELQRRHLPTFSLVSSQGFPVAIEKDDLTIGVKAEHLQKMLENKSDHIKAAFTSAMGRPMTVRVRVLGQATPLRTPSRDRGKKTPPDDPGEDGPASHSPQSSERTSSGRSATAIADPVRTEVERLAPPATMPAHQPKLTPAAPAPAPGGSRQIDASLVDQAYKLFEGPGSRRIT